METVRAGKLRSTADTAQAPHLGCLISEIVPSEPQTLRSPIDLDLASSDRSSPVMLASKVPAYVCDHAW